MTKQAEIIAKLKSLSQVGKQTVFPAEVTSVDEAAMTCDVLFEGIELYSVRLKATEGEGDYSVVIPVVGSSILVGLFGTGDNMFYMVSASEPEKLIGKICDTTYEISATGVVFNNGTNGGVLISQKVVDELAEIKDDLNSLKTAFQNWVTAPNDGGAALKAITATWFGQQLTEPDTTALINLKVKQ